TQLRRRTPGLGVSAVALAVPPGGSARRPWVQRCQGVGPIHQRWEEMDRSTHVSGTDRYTLGGERGYVAGATHSGEGVRRERRAVAMERVRCLRVDVWGLKAGAEQQRVELSSLGPPSRKLVPVAG